MDNLELYNKVREVPQSAKHPITAGRLKGMTDINPMWRIKTLTEQFGPCGIGWYYIIEETWTSEQYSQIEGETDRHLEELVANVRIYLYIKVGGEWSQPIAGVGGSKIISLEKNGFYVDDEAWKKAQTDALSVACKNLGIGADVYWDSDNDKYIDHKKENFNNEQSTAKAKPKSTASTAKQKASEQSTEWQKVYGDIQKYAYAHDMTVREIGKDYGIDYNTPLERMKEVYADLTKENVASTADSNGEHEQEQMANFAEINEQVPWK